MGNLRRCRERARPSKTHRTHSQIFSKVTCVYVRVYGQIFLCMLMYISVSVCWVFRQNRSVGFSKRSVCSETPGTCACTCQCQFHLYEVCSMKHQVI